MSTYFLFGKYTQDALKKIAPDRTRKAINTIQKFGGRVKSVYALLGNNDLVFIVNLPNPAQATLVSIELTKMTGISFSTSVAIPVDENERYTCKCLPGCQPMHATVTPVSHKEQSEHMLECR